MYVAMMFTRIDGGAEGGSGEGFNLLYENFLQSLHLACLHDDQVHIGLLNSMPRRVLRVSQHSKQAQ